MYPCLLVIQRPSAHGCFLKGNVPPTPTHPFILKITEAKQAFISVCSASFLAALLFLFCICYFKQVHNASIFWLSLNATAPENWELGNLVRQRRTIFQQMKHSMQPYLPFPGMGHLFLALKWERNQWWWPSPSCSGIPHHRNHVPRCCWKTHQRPRGGSSPFNCFLMFYFKFPEMGCLNSGWSLLAGSESVGSLRLYLCFSCLPWRVPALSVIAQLI